MELKTRSSNFLNGIIYSISYFTILPIRLDKFEANNQFYKGVVYGLPIVGFVLAMITISAFCLLPFTPIYSAFLSSVIYLFAYGFIHLEALSDTIDGWFASLSKKDVHKIMKEPQIGAIGAIGTFCFILLKVVALSYLLYLEQYIIIVIVLMLSRFSIYFALDLNFHDQSYFANSLKKAVLPSKIVKIILLPLNILTKLILKILQKRLGFLNGDTLGFNIELLEIILLNIGIMLC